jgi:uracil-DNA glycosylase
MDKLYIDKSWKELFEIEYEKKYFEEINNINLDDKELTPKKELIYNAFNLCPLNSVKVVILGQDPYINEGQATGLSFSIPDNTDIKIPPSLKNIFKNQIKFNVINEIPANGNLDRWADQGCLMLNSALTTVLHSSNQHQKYWKKFTNSIIKHISDNKENIVFILWGKDAFNKTKLIDQSKHLIISSTHPCPMSYLKDAKYADAFINVDHFNICNTYLIKHHKKPIIF